MSDITSTTPAEDGDDSGLLLPQDVVDFLNQVNQPGAFQKATITSEIKPAAASKTHELIKVTEAIIRTGVGYENMAVNQDTETGDLPWGDWAVYPYIVLHKGQWYVRLYLKGDSPMKVTYFVDGTEVVKDVFNSHLTPSAAKPKNNKSGTITAKIASVHLG